MESFLRSVSSLTPVHEHSREGLLIRCSVVVVAFRSSTRAFRLHAEPDAAQDQNHADPRIYLRSVHCSAVANRPQCIPLVITLPSTYHSPNTVNRKAKEFVMGTVKLSSTSWSAIYSSKDTLYQLR